MYPYVFFSFVQYTEPSKMITVFSKDFGGHLGKWRPSWMISGGSLSKNNFIINTFLIQSVLHLSLKEQFGQILSPYCRTTRQRDV